MVALFLTRCSEGEGEGGRKLAMKYSLALDFAGQDHIARRSEDVFDYCDCAFGWLNFCALEQIIGSDNYLDEGRLTIQVDMKQGEFIPKNPTSSIMLKLFDHENSADIVFEICENRSNPSRLMVGRGQRHQQQKGILHIASFFNTILRNCPHSALHQMGRLPLYYQRCQTRRVPSLAPLCLRRRDQ